MMACRPRGLVVGGENISAEELSAMSAYRRILAGSIALLGHNTPERRCAIYERARKVITLQLASRDPLASEGEMLSESQALEAAIVEVETAMIASAEPPPQTPPVEAQGEVRPAADAKPA